MRSVPWLIAGFALYKLSDLLEGFGDLAPYATDGVSGERLAFHGTALVVLLIGFACFVRALVIAWRTIRGGGKAEARAVAAVFDDGDGARPNSIRTRRSPAISKKEPRRRPGPRR